MEQPQEFTRGWYFPIRLIRLYEEGEVNAEELMLLGKINALCDEKKGCWATNAWLSEWWNKSPDWTSETINHFRDLGLLSLEVNKAAGNKRTIRILFNGDLPLEDERSSLSEKTPIAIGENSHSYRRKLIGSYTKTNNINKRAHDCRKKRHSGECGSFGLDGGHKLPKPVLAFANFTIKHHLHLGKKGSTKSGWQKYILESWEKSLNELVEQLNGERHLLSKVMKWYFKHWKDEYIPKCYTLKSFCERYSEVKTAMDRFYKDQGCESEDDRPGKWVPTQEADGSITLRRVET